MVKMLDFILDTASGDHPFDPYMSLLKPNGVYALVGFPSEVKFSPASLNIGIAWQAFVLAINYILYSVSFSILYR